MAVLALKTSDIDGLSPQQQADAIGKIASEQCRTSFETLFNHFGPRIKAQMIKTGADQALSEDFVQEVMLRVFRKAHLYRPEMGAVSTWIYRIARNARIDQLRSRSSAPFEDIDGMDFVSEDADGEANAIASERAMRTETAIQTLPDDQRQIIVMAFVEDRSQSEIASALDLPLGTVKSRMRLAYGKLRTVLEDLR